MIDMQIEKNDQQNLEDKIRNSFTRHCNSKMLI